MGVVAVVVVEELLVGKIVVIVGVVGVVTITVTISESILSDVSMTTNVIL